MKEKTKHIALRFFAVRGLQKIRVVKILKIGTDFNPSDIGTKSLGVITFSRHMATVVKECPPAKGGRDSENLQILDAESINENMASNIAGLVKLVSGWTTVKYRRRK